MKGRRHNFQKHEKVASYNKLKFEETRMNTTKEALRSEGWKWNVGEN